MKFFNTVLSLSILFVTTYSMADEALQPGAVQAEIGKQIFEVETSVGYAQGHVEGDSFGQSRLKAATRYRYSDLWSFGPSLTISQSNQSIDLFDKFQGAEFGLDVVAQKPVGNMTPFVKANVVLASIFQAEGNIVRTITNGIENGEGMIEFPQADGWIVGSSESRVDNFGYELKGRTQGAEISVGSKYAFTKQLSLIGELGFSAKSMIVNEAKGSTYGMIGGAEYSYDQRRGINAKGNNINEGFDVDM